MRFLLPLAFVLLLAAGCSDDNEAGATQPANPAASAAAVGGAQHAAERGQEPDEAEPWPETAPVKVPAVVGMTLSQAAAALRAAGLDVAVRGTGTEVVAQSVRPSRVVPRATPVTVTVR